MEEETYFEIFETWGWDYIPEWIDEALDDLLDAIVDPYA